MSRNEQTKRKCNCCSLRKPLDPQHFAMKPNGDLITVCRSCMRRPVPGHVPIDRNGHRVCAICDANKPLDAKHYRIARDRQWTKSCRDCLVKREHLSVSPPMNLSFIDNIDRAPIVDLTRRDAPVEPARECHGEPGPAHDVAVAYSKAITQAGRDGTLHALPPFAEWRAAQ